MEAVSNGCCVFYFGGYGDFDTFCYNIVTEIKESTGLDIKRIYCVSQERYLRKLPKNIKAQDYEGIEYLMPSFDGWYKSIYFRNCAMIDASNVIIFYAEERENSGAYKAYKYARRKKDKLTVNLWNK